MKPLRFAIGFLTVFPVAPKDSPMELASSRAYFPLVGLLLGGVLAAIDFVLRPILPPLLLGAVIVVALIVLTRALHIDGFMDSCDGLLGGFTRKRRLEIMRDSHVGAFAVVGVVSLLLLKWMSIAALPASLRLPILALFPCLSRWAMLFDMQKYSYVRRQGLGTSFTLGQKKSQYYFGLAVALIASVLLAGFAGLVLFVAVTGVAWGAGRWMASLLGGLTGDSYGAINEVSEVAVLMLVIIFAALSTLIFTSPISIWI